MLDFFQITCSPDEDGFRNFHTFVRINGKYVCDLFGVEIQPSSYIVSADTWSKIVCLKCRKEIDHPQGGES